MGVEARGRFGAGELSAHGSSVWSDCDGRGWAVCTDGISYTSGGEDAAAADLSACIYRDDAGAWSGAWTTSVAATGGAVGGGVHDACRCDGCRRTRDVSCFAAS